MQEIFRKAFTRSTLPVQHTQGFNPAPRLEFVGNLPVGVESLAEIASCILDKVVTEYEFTEGLNASLPPGLRITKTFVFPVSNKRKRESLVTNWWGSTWELRFYDAMQAPVFWAHEAVQTFFADTAQEATTTVNLRADQERPFRDLFQTVVGKPYYANAKLKKTATITKDNTDFFQTYAKIAELNRELIN
jgi:radical SAM-linked protein